MLRNMIKMWLFCDAELAHNPIFNYYLSLSKNKEKGLLWFNASWTAAVGKPTAFYIDGGSKFQVFLFI